MKNILLKTALLAGTLDITAAILNFMLKGGGNPTIVLQYIASGLFGKETAFSHAAMPSIGLLLHYFIAFAFTVFYFFVGYKVFEQFKYWQLSGVFYGIFVWFVMNKIIVPMSLIMPRPSTLSNDFTQMGILIVCIGLPIAYFSHQIIRK